MKPSTCKSCGASILWCKTAQGKKTPVDAAPVRVAELVEDPETGEYVTQGGLHIIERGVVGHISHWATCPTASSHRK